MRISKCAKTKKVRYRTLLDAKMALAKTYTSNKPTRNEKRYYLCPFCKGFHLTSETMNSNKSTFNKVNRKHK